MDIKQVITVFTQMEVTIDSNTGSYKTGRIIKQWQSMTGPQTKKEKPVQRALVVGAVETEEM
jgi:hypothetical protein